MGLTAILTRPAAMIAVFAGIIIVLSLAATWLRWAMRRREARRSAERRGRCIVRKLKHCPFFSREQDRRLAKKFAKELEEFIAKEGFTLDQLGANQAEIDRAIKDAMCEKEAASTKLQGLIVEYRERKSRLTPITPARKPGEPIVPPVTEVPQVPETEQVAASATQSEPYGVTFTAADFTGDGVVEFDLSEVGVEPRAVETAPICNGDPLTALRTVDQRELDEYVDQRFATIFEQEN
jgi:hypothetical protein